MQIDNFKDMKNLFADDILSFTMAAKKLFADERYEDVISVCQRFYSIRTKDQHFFDNICTILLFRSLLLVVG